MPVLLLEIVGWVEALRNPTYPQPVVPPERRLSSKHIKQYYW
ncbi:hypothetical protein [Dulcicalothrix desertica]|nr:hypothetical protein [Dulcicalothrix desertica]